MRARGLLVAAAVFGVLAWAEPALADTLVVDDDRAQCPGAGFTSINAAVAAARPGDDIDVCPGTYPETVTVTKPELTLKGWTQVGRDRCLASPASPNPAQDTVVQGRFVLQADKVELLRFWVEGVTEAGISTSHEFSGYLIKENLVQRHGIGVYLQGSGAHETLVEQNCLRDNAFLGNLGGAGILSDRGLHRATILGNTFTRNSFTSIVIGAVLTLPEPEQTFDPLRNTDVTVKDNLMVDDGQLAVLNGTRFEIVGNTQVRPQATAIQVVEEAVDVVVKDNQIVDGAFSGIVLFSAFGVSTPTNVLVIGNEVIRAGRAAPRDGIRLIDTSGHTVIDNIVRMNSRDGISLTASSGNTVKGNKSFDNVRDGIRSDAASTVNTFDGNKALGNLEHDCHDDSVGPGTGGTANAWIGNEGRTENRPGLCRKD